MKQKKEIHLAEKQIVQAIVDITDLPLWMQNHLSSCLECHLVKRQLELEIEQLGYEAASYVPVPKHRICLPLEKMSHDKKWFVQWKTSFGLMATAFFIFFISWGVYMIQHSPLEKDHQLVLETQDAEELIIEVNMLAENALPKVYRELSKEIEIETDFENLFLEYIIPLTEEDSLSLKFDNKGELTC